MRPRLAALVILASLLASPAAGQEPVDAAMLARIRAEGLERSRTQELFGTLTDVIGGRLTGSPAHHEAAAWARDRFAEWGLESARLDPFPFGRGWSLEELSLELLAPRYMPLLGYAEAWPPSTNGALTGEIVYVGDKTGEQIDAMGERLRGAIVLTHQPQTAFVMTDRPQPTDAEGVRIGNPQGTPLRSVTPMQQVTPRLQAAGAGVVLKPNIHEHGTVLVLGNRGTRSDAVPSIVLAAEQYNMLARMAEAGMAPRLRVEIVTRYHEQDTMSYNVLAEIPGIDPALRDEVVLIGGHLDSWHTSNGATDNADGAVGAMEAMRILSAVGARPRRTIRVALWGGEEQGLLGARAYVAQYLGDSVSQAKHSVFLNDDPGTGATYGFYMQNNPAAKAVFDAWLVPLGDLGVRRNVIEPIGSTDHVPFDEIGVPGFTAIKDFTDYDRRSRHTNADYFERTDPEDLAQSAIVMASFAWLAAQREEAIPRARPPQ